MGEGFAEATRVKREEWAKTKLLMGEKRWKKWGGLVAVIRGQGKCQLKGKKALYLAFASPISRLQSCRVGPSVQGGATSY